MKSPCATRSLWARPSPPLRRVSKAYPVSKGKGVGRNGLADVKKGYSGAQDPAGGWQNGRYFSWSWAWRLVKMNILSL